MVVNFRAREISRDPRKLARTSMLIKKKLLQLILIDDSTDYILDLFFNGHEFESFQDY
jgi:hypothetical protein